MPYTLRQLEYFIAAGETGSITLASERIHISQPSISTAISHLEKEFGVQLFIRHHAQGLSLTPAGRDLLREAKELICASGGPLHACLGSERQGPGATSLGCMVTLAPMFVPELAQSFQTAFPATQVRHTEGNQEQLLEGLRRAEVDVAIAYDLNTPEDILFKPLVSLPPHVVVSEAHPFARQTAVSLRELVSEPMILLDLPLSREYFLSLFHNAGLQPLVVARSAHQEVVRTMVANGYGYSIFNVRPRSNHALDGRKLMRVRLAGTHRPMIIGTATLKLLRQSRLVEAFETHCRSFISKSYIPGMVAPALERTVRVRDSATTPV